jgi:hypothetical protein
MTDMGNAYTQANAAYTQSNTARSDANTTFATINTSFGTINTNYQAAYAQANQAYSAANSANQYAFNSQITVTANTNVAAVPRPLRLNFVNTSTITVSVTNDSGNANIEFTAVGGAAYDQANAAYAQANTARSDANTTFGTINTTFGTVNTSLGTINTNYQAAYAQANTARTTANDAYATANTKLGTSGGSISGDLTISGNLVVQGNATTINVSSLSVNDSIILLSSNSSGDAEDIGFVGHITRDSTNTHVGLIRKATENRFYLFDNYEVELTNNTIDITGNNFRVGNIRLGIINANSFVTVAGLDVTGQANAAYSQANAAYGQANTARSDANTTFATVNTTFGTINTSLGTINTNYQAAYAQANAAYGQANAAYGAANNRVLKAGDTMTGQLNISSGGLLVTGDVGFGASPAFTSGSGLEIQRATATATLRLDSSSFATELYGYTGGTGLFQLSAGYLDLGTNNTTRMRIDANGNVGIGTTTTTAKLTIGGVTLSQATSALDFNVAGSGTYQRAIRVLNSSMGSANGIAFQIGKADSTRNVGQMVYNHVSDGSTDNYIEFGMYAVDQILNLTGNGRVGIGTTNPTTKLEVVGTISYKPSVGTSLTLGDDGTYGTSGTGRYTTLGFSGNNNGGNRIFAHNTGEDGLYICSATSRGIAFRVNGGGTNNVLIDSSGNVGIGTTNPSTRLHLYNTSGDVELRLSADGSSDPMIRLTGENNGTGEGFRLWYDNSVGDTYFDSVYDGTLTSPAIRFRTKTNATTVEAMTIMHNGNVAIGTTSSAFKATVAADVTMSGDINPGTAQLSLEGVSDTRKRMLLGYDTNSNGYGFIKCGFYNNTWTALAIQPNGGSVGVGTTNPQEKLHVVGNMVATGSITASYSDERLKDVISPVNNAIEKIKQIRSVYYKPNELVKSLYPEQEDRTFVGVIAQSVKKVLPEVVVPSPIDKNYDTVQYDRLVSLLIAAVQEQQKQIDELKSKLGV